MALGQDATSASDDARSAADRVGSSPAGRRIAALVIGAAAILALLIAVLFWRLGAGPDDSVVEVSTPADRGISPQELNSWAESKATILADLLFLEQSLKRVEEAARAQLERAEIEGSVVHSRAEWLAVRGVTAAAIGDTILRLRAAPLPANVSAVGEFEHVLNAAQDTLRDGENALAQLDSALRARVRFETLVDRWRQEGGEWPLATTAVAPTVPAELLFDASDLAGQPVLIVMESDSAAEALQALEGGDFVTAMDRWGAAEQSLVDAFATRDVERRASRESVAEILELADQAIEENRLTTPAGDSAYDYLRAAAAIDATHPGLDAAREKVVLRYSILADQALSRGDLVRAESFLRRAQTVVSDSPGLRSLRNKISEAEGATRRGSLADRLRQAVAFGRAGDIDGLAREVEALRRMAPDDPRVTQVEARYRIMLREQGREFTDVFVDSAEHGPLMVVAPTGRFVMGQPRRRFGLFGRDERLEQPEQVVQIERPFAIAAMEVTVGQFRAFVDSTGYQTDAERAGSIETLTARGRVQLANRNFRHDYLGNPAADEFPVIHVSWRDANAYTQWLAERTGRAYRLPSEAEFEFVLRAGSTTRFAWGDRPVPPAIVENLLGGDTAPSAWGRGDGIEVERAMRDYRDGHFGPAPVASFPRNEFALHDLAGNVSEWTADCAYDSHQGRPADARARDSGGDCNRRVVRGASWASPVEHARSTFRALEPVYAAHSALGFRVARDLDD